MVSPLDDVLEKLRERLVARRAEASERAERIREAADAYVAAVERGIAAEVAALHEIDVGLEQESPLAREAAEALRDLVDALPELELAPAPISAPHGPAVASSPISSAALGHSDGFVREAGPEARALYQEVRNLDFDSMPIGIFRVHASELAARARSLQARGLEEEDIPGRIIRKLTAVTASKGVSNIFGLSRKHQADWDGIAARQREARERMATGQDPAPRSSRTSGSDDSDEDEDADYELAEDALRLPLVTAATRTGAVIVVGGIVKQEKLDRTQRKYGIDLEWIDTQRNGTHVVGALEHRIRDGHVAGLVLLNGLLGHVHSEPIVAAARRAQVPVAYADRGGTGAFARALTDLEEQLQRRTAG